MHFISIYNIQTVQAGQTPAKFSNSVHSNILVAHFAGDSALAGVNEAFQGGASDSMPSNPTGEVHFSRC